MRRRRHCSNVDDNGRLQGICVCGHRKHDHDVPSSDHCYRCDCKHFKKKVVKLSEKLFKKLEELDLNPSELPKRIIVGYWQRAAGAWKWSCHTSTYCEIGSQWSMTEVLNAKEISISKELTDIHITVEKEGNKKEVKKRKKVLGSESNAELTEDGRLIFHSTHRINFNQ